MKYFRRKDVAISYSERRDYLVTLIMTLPTRTEHNRIVKYIITVIEYLQ